MHQEAIQVIEEIDAERHVKEEFAEPEGQMTRHDRYSVVRTESFRATVAVTSICSVEFHFRGYVHVAPLGRRMSYSHEVERQGGSLVPLTWQWVLARSFQLPC